jgi:uncharacterized protein YjiK
MFGSLSLQPLVLVLLFLLPSRADDLDLGSLQYCGKQSLPEVDDNLSGVSVDLDTGTLVAVINKPAALIRYDPFASTSCALTKYESIENTACDSEGVTFLGAGKVAVSQEADLDDSVPGQRVIVYDAATFTSTGEAYQLKGLDDEGVEHNSGLEGVAYDQQTMTFYVAREGKHDKDKMAVYSFKRNATLAARGAEDSDVHFTTIFQGITAFDGADVSMTDLAGVSFVENSEPSLLLLSQETKTVALVTIDPFEVRGKLEVPSDAQQPEGVAWDPTNRRLWVVGEPNEVMLWAEDCTARGTFAAGCEATSPPTSTPPPPITSSSPLRLNEVADKSCERGCGDELCDGEDWVELYNPSRARVDLAGYVLSDDGGPTDARAYHFPEGDAVDPGGFRVLCKNREFVYGIGGSDTVSLWDDRGDMVDTTGRLSKGGEPGNSYARETDGYGAWGYTAIGSTTQGSSNNPTGGGTGDGDGDGDGDGEGKQSGGGVVAVGWSEIGAVVAVGATAAVGFAASAYKDVAAQRWREWRRGDPRRGFLELSEDV